MFYIMFLTGLRVGELGGLMWNDIDFEKKCQFYEDLARSLQDNPFFKYKITN